MALECRALGSFCLSGISALYTDLTCMTGAILVIHTICRLAVDVRTVRSLASLTAHRITHGIRIDSFPALLKTVTACLLRVLRVTSSHLDLVQFAEILVIVYTALYSTF